MKQALPLFWHLATCLAAFDEVASLAPPTYDAALDAGSHGYYPVQKFVTTEHTAPQTNFLQWSPRCDDGMNYFITPKGWSVPKPGPVILDQDGSMIWSEHFANDFGGQAYDLKVQTYQGDDYLTFWLGDDTVRGHGAGQYYMLNASYDIVHKVTAANDKFADLHELIITPDGTALMIVFEVVPADVRSLGRNFNDVWNQAIWDCLVQEVHIATGELRFEWRASEHLNISRTYMKLDSMAEGTQENPFDPYHLNSVEKDALGNYLISARNPHAIYYIDGRTGETIWTLGGMDNSFMELNDGPMQALNFAWQHDVRFVPTYAFPETYIPPPDREGTTVILLTMFDNAAVDWDYSYGTPCSRGLLLELTYPTPGFYTGKKMTRVEFTAARIDDRGSREPQESLSKLDAAKVASINGKSASHTVRLVREFINPKHVRSGTQGSVQLIPQGPGLDPKALVGYGLNAVITEYNSNGSVLCDLHFGAESSWERGDVQSYRAHKSHWVGRPKTGPVAAVQGNEVFVSWNGATEVRSWLLQALDSVEEGWVEVSRTRKQGFETTIHLPEEYRAARHLRLFALDSEGRLCEHGISNVISRNAFGIALRQHMNGSGLPTFTSFVYLVCSAFGIAALYRLLLRYLSWRRGRTRFGQTSRRRGQA